MVGLITAIIVTNLFTNKFLKSGEIGKFFGYTFAICIPLNIITLIAYQILSK